MSKMCHSLLGKTCVVTGAKEGIGSQITLGLAARYAKVIMVDYQDLEESKQKIVNSTGNTNIVVKYADFTSLSSVRCLAEEINSEEKRLDVLINNVGVFCLGTERTEDGLNATMQVNHFSPFLFTNLLVDLVKESAPSRIIFTSSITAFCHRLNLDTINCPTQSCIPPLSPFTLYCNSKLCNIISANAFAERLQEAGVSSNSFHPGMTSTNLLWKNKPFNKFLTYVLQDSAKGAQNAIFLATSPKLTKTTGKFFVNLREHQQPQIVTNRKFCENLWEITKSYVNL